MSRKENKNGPVAPSMPQPSTATGDLLLFLLLRQLQVIINMKMTVKDQFLQLQELNSF